MTARTWLRFMSIGFALAASSSCGSSPEAPGAEDVGQIGIRLSSVPSDGTCIRFTTTAGTRTIQQSFDAVADTPLTAALHGLPYNQTLSIFAEAFAGTCSALSMSTLATYLSDPQSAIVAPGETKALSFTLRPTGNVNGSADFLFLTMTPTTRAFGNVVVGQQSAPFAFTVTNIGMVPTSPLSATLTELSSVTGQFSIASNGCTGPLAPSQTCQVQVAFNPTVPGSKSGTLQVSGMTGGTLSATVSGVGWTPAHLSISPPMGNLGNIPVGSFSQFANFTISNTADQPTGPLATTLDPSGGEFVLSSSCNSILSGHSNCAVTVFFIPQTIGPKSATVTVTGTPGGTVTGSISATAVSPLTFSPTSADFGSAAVGSRGLSQTFTVRNTSSQTSAALTVVSASADFTVTSDACSGKTIGANATCTITVQLSPTMAGPLSGALNVNAAAGWSAQAALTGSGT